MLFLSSLPPPSQPPFCMQQAIDAFSRPRAAMVLFYFFLLTCFNRNVDDVATFQAGAGDGTKMDGENMLWEQQVAINREVLNGNEAFVVSTHLSLC